MPAMADDRDLEVKILARMNRDFESYIPHNKELALEAIELGDARARFRLPYDAKLVGNPETGVLHGGAITALLDACSGAAVFMALSMPTNIATLDLRIDYLRPATPHLPVHAEAHCYRKTCARSPITRAPTIRSRRRPRPSCSTHR
jgi:uncharacterized protein (TIGR00369 family)